MFAVMDTGLRIDPRIAGIAGVQGPAVDAAAAAAAAAEPPAEPPPAEPAAAEPSAAEPSAAEPSAAEPSAAEPSAAPSYASTGGKRPASLALGQLSESEPKKQKQKSLASRQNLWFCNCREEWPRPKGTQGNPHHQDECRREQATKRVIKEQPIAGETVLHMLPRAKKAGRRSRRFSGPGQDDWEESSEEEQSL